MDGSADGTGATTPGFDWERGIAERALGAGVSLAPPAVAALAAHARAVLRAGAELRLTSITEEAEFLERHIGEALEGAAMLDPAVSGPALDLGSGNGYPGLVLAAARPGLQVLLAEASARKAAFLRGLLADFGPGVAVLEAQIQRPADLYDVEPLRVVTTRAMGGWVKIVPRLASMLAADADVLVWAGDEVERIRTRAVWRRLELVDRRPLPGRERSWVWRFRRP